MTALFDENNNIVSGTLNIGSGTVYDIVLSDTSGNRTIFNQNNLNIDLAVSGTGTGDVLFFDASTGRLGLNTESPDAAFHVITDCALDGVKIESVTNCATGVKLLLVHNTQTAPATGSFPATIELAGRDNNFNTINYGQIKSKILNPATNSTSGEILFTVDHTGVNKEVFRSSLVNTVLGGLNTADGNEYNVIGYNNTVSGLSYIVLGDNNNTIHNTGIVIGSDMKTSGNKAIVLGQNSTFSGLSIIGLVVDSSVSGESTIAIGSDISVTGDQGIIIGNSNIANGLNNIGLISNTTIVGNSGIGFGNNQFIQGDANIYIGHQVNVSGTDSIVFGSRVGATGMANMVFGNSSNASGNNIISIGTDNTSTNINSGIYIGNNIDLSNSNKSIVMGLGVTTTSGLDQSIMIGLDNSTLDASPTGLVLIGQSNTVSHMKDSLVIGNENNLSGNVHNNILIGPKNSVPLISNNNLVIGVLNNTTGITINTDGTFTGDGVKADGDSMSNTSVFGINNLVTAASGSTIIGNKTRVSGLNINNIGSYVNLNNSDNQNIGNSNFVLGSRNTTIGSKNDIIGSSSVSINTSNDRNQIFGDNSIVIGHNEVVFSGISVGYDNEIYGIDNIVYGRNNTLGFVRHPCKVSGTNVVVVGDVSSDFDGGDRVLVGIYSPASQTESVFIRTITDGVDNLGNSLGVVTENIGSNYTTTLNLSSTMNSDDTVEYYIKDTFDDIVQGQDPCSECFADRFAGFSSGYVIAYQDGNDVDAAITSPRFGQFSTVLGSSNTVRHMSGLVLGNNNHISGINHIAIGYGLSGNYNEAIQIGTNNSNKLYLDDDKVVFNTGSFQNNIIFHTSNYAGDNQKYAMRIDLFNNRMGVNSAVPRSTLDVSGTLTTDQLRVGLSSISGYTLHADNSGNASWQKPTTFIGGNSGLLFKTSSTVASGLKEVFFNTASGVKSFEYVRANRVLSGNDSFDFIEGNETEDRVFIINQTGLYLNNGANDHGFNLSIKGSGIQTPVNGDNSIYLFNTDILNNSVRMHNITGISGQFGEMNIGAGLKVPLNLTGTNLTVDSSNGALKSQTFDKHDVLFTRSNFQTSGTNAFRYYEDSQALTIGLTGTPPETANTSLVEGASNTFSHIILASDQGKNTVFNNAGLGNKFIISQSGQGGTKLGFQYYSASGALGIGVSDTNLWDISPTASNKPWWEAGKLVVDGKLRASAIQLTPNGRSAGTTANRYLKTIDEAGNIGLDSLDLSYQFSGLHPLQVTQSQGNDEITISMSKRVYPGVTTSIISDTENGMSIVWNGIDWKHSKGFRFHQPENNSTNTDATPGIEAGNDLSLNSCRNNHVEGGGSFARGIDSFKGSSQVSKFYLRGRTAGNVNNVELVSDWHKNANTTPDANNTISLQYLNTYDNSNAVDHNRTMAWNYKVHYTALFSDDESAPTFGMVGGTVEGSVISYKASDGTRTNVPVTGSITKRMNTGGPDYTSKDPIQVYVDASNPNFQRLRIDANGTNEQTSGDTLNGMFHVEVEINQVHMPSGIVFGNSAIV